MNTPRVFGNIVAIEEYSKSLQRRKLVHWVSSLSEVKSRDIIPNNKTKKKTAEGSRLLKPQKVKKTEIELISKEV